jgi:hypothetical protein
MGKLSLCDVCCIRTKCTRIVCPQCKYTACNKCYKMYIIGNQTFAKCMSCRELFTLKFMLESFVKTWVKNTYKDHVKKVLFNNALSKIETTYKYMQIVNEYKSKYREFIQAEKAYVEQFHNYNIENTRVVTCLFANHSVVHKTKTKLPEKKKREKLRAERNYLKHEIMLLYPQTEMHNFLFHKSATARNDSAGSMFYTTCPIKDCKGAIAKTDNKCCKCDTLICPTCWCPNNTERSDGDTEQSAGDHVCDETIVQNVNNIKKTTKQCPRCFVPIMRISGCSQMFCTNCKIAFCWRTGEVLSFRRVHNPHLTEYLNQQQQENNNTNNTDNDNHPGCETEFPYMNTSRSDLQKIVDLVRQVHIEIVPNHSLINEREYILKTELAKYDYVMETISQEELENRLYDAFLEYDKINEALQILDMFQVVGIDILRTCKVKLSENKKSIIAQHDIETETVEKFINFTRYANDLLCETNRLYCRSKPPYQFIFMYNNHNRFDLTIRRKNMYTLHRYFRNPDAGNPPDSYRCIFG